MKAKNPKQQGQSSAGKAASKPVKGEAADKTNDESFPGYPAYPAEEDIMNADNEHNKVDLDVENVARSARINNELSPQRKAERKKEGKGDTWEPDESGDDLDVPGAELDDESEAAGNEDEENNFYSLGGDRHEDLEEDQS
ncbi:hypothetical protein [Chitinophaga defluvii]|uniref:Uncharacterized protein n=1 Tax=Chitinophaga defluvii TaxID=3163343 RepID=A0ABV2TAM7_9BACT